jgi:beta-phosphoglucomutase-like phosphatase (HAD superfamily)
MIKLIIFDLDGVLVEAKKIHYDTLNTALWEIAQSNKYVITEAEHLSIYDGLKTNQKLFYLLNIINYIMNSK